MSLRNEANSSRAVERYEFASPHRPFAVPLAMTWWRCDCFVLTTDALFFVFISKH